MPTTTTTARRDSSSPLTTSAAAISGMAEKNVGTFDICCSETGSKSSCTSDDLHVQKPLPLQPRNELFCCSETGSKSSCTSDDLHVPKPSPLQARNKLEVARAGAGGGAVRRHNGEVLGPGMVLLRRYVSLDEQVEIVRRCRELGVGTGGFYESTRPRLHLMCLGLDWDPKTGKYDAVRPRDGAKPPAIPVDFSELVERSLRDAQASISKKKRGVDDGPQGVLPSMSPDVCIVNFYSTTEKLGFHRDRDESSESLREGLPVVSISIGDSAEFLYKDRRHSRAKDVILKSGDVLIFGGESRHIYHGVSKIIENSAPMELWQEARLRPGRLNLTFRKF